MVSLREATKHVDPFIEILSPESQRKLIQANEHYSEKHYSRAEKIYSEIETSISGTSTKNIASKYALLSNIFKMRALAAERKNDLKTMKASLEESKKNLELALQQEPYWAQYMDSVSKLNRFIHYYFGCEIKKEGRAWTTSCYRISRALGLPGLSPGMQVKLECSICGKDPLECPHIPGQVYEGRICLNVANHIEVEEISLVDIPAQGTTYISPHSLTENDLRRILPNKKAEGTISGTCELTCNDLLNAIEKLKLKGIDWK